MIENYAEGIAFILEGSTEKVFYLNLLKYFADTDKQIVFKKIVSEEDGEIFYEWISETKKMIIKIYVVGTITQVSNSGNWFRSKCSKKLKIPWSVEKIINNMPLDLQQLKNNIFNEPEMK